MRSYLPCIPCFIRQTYETVNAVTDDKKIQEEVLRAVLRDTSKMDLNISPPQMGQHIHRLIREKTGNKDPFYEIKQRFNQQVIASYDEFQSKIDTSKNPLDTAVRFAIAGNMIDAGANRNLDNFVIHTAIEDAMFSTLCWDQVRFQQLIDEAQSILYLADNAGEIVFDRLLIEKLPAEKITVAVRGKPILNDATIAEAQQCGLTEIVKVIDNGSDAPGTILDDCSQAFVETFQQADLIIAKGQGNYETLSDTDKTVIFILKAKCPVIAQDIGCEVGAMIANIHNDAHSTTYQTQGIAK